MSENGAPPDQLRCRRTDGRKWRCKRQAVEGQKLCEVHILRGRNKQKDSTGLSKGENLTQETSARKELKRKKTVSGELGDTQKRMKMKRGHLPWEAIRESLKRQVEKKRKKKEVEMLNSGIELTLELPGSREFENDAKPLPISEKEVSSLAQNVSGGLASNWWSLNKYIEQCETKEECPLCVGKCRCKIKKRDQLTIINKEYHTGMRKADKIQLLYYLVYTLLPVLKQINQEQDIELDIDASIRGKDLEASAEELLCEYEVPEAPIGSTCYSVSRDPDLKASEVSLNKRLSSRTDSCNDLLCRATIMNLHEDNLEHFQSHWKNGRPVIVRNVLRSMSDINWDPVVMFCSYLDQKAKCKNCKGAVIDGTCLDWCEAEIVKKQILVGSLAQRTRASMRDQSIKFRAWLSSHLFQQLFPAHHAEILQSLPFLEYTDPLSGLLNLAVKLPKELPKPELGPRVHISYGGSEELVHEGLLTKLHYDLSDVVNVLACATEVPISSEQFDRIRFLMKKHQNQDNRGSTSNTGNRKEQSLHNKDTKESRLHDVIEGRVQLPKGTAEIPLCCEGTSPSVDKDFSNDVGYESRSDSGTIRRFESSESELLHDDPQSSTSSDREKVANSCGAQWDIFRREDISKLLKYLRKHCNEFRSLHSRPKHVFHSMFDQNIFLDEFHKMRLKEEYGVQPWTIEQHAGEAVIIPAGCPYQIRKPKSCVSVTVDFISPENASNCISLTEEIRSLPARHKARQKMLEVKKMALYGISDAIQEIRRVLRAEQVL